MKVTVEIGGRRHAAVVPHAEADHVRVPGVERCPGCGHDAREGGGLKVHGGARRIESSDTYASDGKTGCCGATIGTVRAVVSTIFGIEEDEAVLLRSRCRVY